MADLAGFETFTKRMTPLGRKPYVTIQKRGLMSFNKAAHIALGEPSAVELMYNKDAQIIAVRAASEDVAHAYPFRSLGGQKKDGPADPTTFIVGATAFTNYYAIPTEVSKRWQAEVVDKVLFIDLKTEGLVVTSNRRSKTDENHASSSDVGTTTSKDGKGATEQ